MIDTKEIENKVANCVQSLKAKYQGTQQYLDLMIHLSCVLEKHLDTIDNEIDEIWKGSEDDYWEDDDEEWLEDTDDDFGWEE